MLVIDAEECIDCGACEPECPVEAILPEDAIPDDWQPFVKINYAFNQDGIADRPRSNAARPGVRRTRRAIDARRVRAGSDQERTTWPASTWRAAAASSSAAARSGSRRPRGSSPAAPASRSSRPSSIEAFAELDVDWLRAAATAAATCAGAFLVIAATSDRAVNERVHRDAEARGMLCNVADVPELCNFILPAVHREGPIAVAVSTGGASPALAKRLRSRRSPSSSRPEHAELARGAARAAPRGEGALRDLRGAARLLRGARRRERLS